MLYGILWQWFMDKAVHTLWLLSILFLFFFCVPGTANRKFFGHWYGEAQVPIIRWEVTMTAGFFLQTQSRERCSAYITDSTTIETIAVPFPISQVEPFTGGINRKMGQGLDQLLFITHDAISQWLLLHPEYSCFPFYAYIHICYL